MCEYKFGSTASVMLLLSCDLPRSVALLHFRSQILCHGLLG